jgi:carboxyl-terminal processing protease
MGARLATGAEAPAPPLQLKSQWDQRSIDFAKLYDAVVQTVDQKFFDETLLKQLDWRARAEAVRPTVLAAATAEDAVGLINALLAELKTSHTALFTPDEYMYYVLLDLVPPPALQPAPPYIVTGPFGALVGASSGDLMARRFWGSGPYYPGIGAFTRESDGHHFVDGVLEGSPADQSGLKYGDEALSVDGMPYSPVAAFRGKIGTTVELTIRREAGAQPQRLRVPVIPIRPIRAFSEATEASARIIERNGRRIGYVHIWSSAESNSFKTALSKLEPIQIIQDRFSVRSTASKPIDFLIVDMRGRVGGNIAVANQFLELLDAGRKPFPYWGSWRTLDRNQAGFARPEAPPFRGRSALLIDDHTRSAAEIMAHGYKRSGFGLVVGTPTAGAVSSGSTFVMPGDLLLYVAVVGHEFDGQPLEGVGVTPDHRIERPLPYAAGADPVLDGAVDLLAEQAPKPFPR